MIIEVIANLEDLIRIKRLEDEGKLWPGATRYSSEHALAYLLRIAELIPGPRRIPCER